MAYGRKKKRYMGRDRMKIFLMVLSIAIGILFTVKIHVIMSDIEQVIVFLLFAIFAQQTFTNIMS